MPTPIPTAAERRLRIDIKAELLGIEIESVPEQAGLPIFGVGPAPEPDGVFSAFELVARSQVFAQLLGI